MINQKPDLKTIIKNGKWLETILADKTSKWQYRKAHSEALEITKIVPRYEDDGELFSTAFLEPDYLFTLLDIVAKGGYEASIADPYLIPVDRENNSEVKIESDKSIDVLMKADFFKELYKNYTERKFDEIVKTQEKENQNNHIDLSKEAQGEYALCKEHVVSSVTADPGSADIRCFIIYWFSPLRDFYRLKYNIRDWLRDTTITKTPLLFSFGSFLWKDYILNFYNNIQPLIKFEQGKGFIVEQGLLSYTPMHILNCSFCRIFIDFLFAGGLEYCGFCEYCKNFWVAERKGRKKFCSDICRTNNQRPPQ